MFYIGSYFYIFTCPFMRLERSFMNKNLLDVIETTLIMLAFAIVILSTSVIDLIDHNFAGVIMIGVAILIYKVFKNKNL